MKLHGLITTALVIVLGTALLAQNPRGPTKPVVTDNARGDAALGEKLDVLLGQLKHGSVEQRREAALALGRIGERAKAAAPALAEVLNCEDRVLRIAVAEALWQANKDPAALAALATVLKDKYDAFRENHVLPNAVEALGRIGVDAKAAVPALLEALDNSWASERTWAAWASQPPSRAPGCCAGGRFPPARLSPSQALWLLWRIEKHPAVMPALLKALKDPDHRVGAARTLSRIGADAKEAVPALLKLLDDDTQNRQAIASALWHIKKHPAYVSVLVEGLKDKSADIRFGSICALEGIGVEAKAAVPALAEALKDEKVHIARAAAQALGRLGPEAKAAVPALLRALKDWGHARVAIAEALWRINKHPAAVSALAESLQDSEDGSAAAWVLGRIGVEAKAAVPALVEALKERRVERRVAVAVTLWKINKHPAVVPVLVDALKDKKADGYKRMFAAKALWQINKHPAAVPALIEVLKVKEASMRIQTAEALWQINRHPAAVAALLEALNDRDNWVSSAAAKTLGRIGAEANAAEAALAEALQDEDEGVCTSAAQGLKEIGCFSSSPDGKTIASCSGATTHLWEVLKALAKGSSDARLTREAEASLKSLGRRHVALGKATGTVPIGGAPR